MIETRAGKVAIVAALGVLSLAFLFASAGAKSPKRIQSIAVVLACVGAWVAFRVRTPEPTTPAYPLGDAGAFVAAVPEHARRLAKWAVAQGAPPPPSDSASLDEWIWNHRAALGRDWLSTMHGLVAVYGEALRRESQGLEWCVHDGEPTVRARHSVWPSRRLFNDVHDAVFADV